VGDIELRHLATIAAVAEEGTFGRAAARLGYTRSTVSQQVAALERAVSGVLFDRPGGPRPVRITPLGAVVLEHGRDLLAKAERLADTVDRFKAGDGRIDIGTFQSGSNVILPSVVRRLRDEHPGCEIRLSEEEPDEPQIGDLALLFYDGRLDGDVEHAKLIDTGPCTSGSSTAGLRIHELRPARAREVFLHWPAGRTRSPLAARAIAIAIARRSRASWQNGSDARLSARGGPRSARSGSPGG
jgi:hypothetical protein